MKRFSIFIISMTMLISLISGCNKQNDPAGILICGFSDSVPEIKVDLEYSEWSKEAYIDSKQPKTAVVKIYGTTYQGEYVETDLTFGSYELRHSYKDEKKRFFELDSNGNLMAYFWGSSDIVGQVKSQKECEKIACDFILETSNVSIENYEKSVSYDKEHKLYTVTFIKYIGMIKSEDQATIVVEETGNLYSFRFNMFGKISEANVPDFDLDKINTKLTEKLDLATTEARRAYDTIGYENFTYCISMTSPTEYVLLCSVDVKCCKSQGDYDIVMREKLQFVVPLS